MATTQALLTPLTDTKPVVVKVQRELSGEHWCARFPRSKSLGDLSPSFQESVRQFKLALENAGAQVDITNTFRPRESCYLMCYAWLIYKEKIDPSEIPSMANVLIEWTHKTKEDSWNAAKRMCRSYGILKLQTKPAIDSNHTYGDAVDMLITWKHSLDIVNKKGETVCITSTPRDGMNLDLKEVGASYGVIKYFGGYQDVPHWSTNGK